jgi:tRNA A-37 threonylcarbamoyl transferase component Bud32
MSPPTTAEQLLELLNKSGLLDPQRLQEYARERRAAGTLPAAPEELADVLVADGLLTRFQAKQLLCGRHRNFILSGKYKILQPLGAGGMGQVFLCEHAIMHRRVALKLLPSGQAEDPSAVERFHREVRAVARLRHPNIVTAHDADRDGDLHFLVMEYIDGLTLDRLVKEEGPLAPAQAADYVRQAALGLQHAHEHGLVHRDIKPSNILVDREGTVKILDLGLARFFHDEADDLSRRHEQSPLGTTDYMAPEQALDSHTADGRADVYSLGATLYFLLAGHGPFRGGTLAEKVVWLQTRQPRPIRELRPDVPAELAAVLERMMAKEPGQRFQTPAEVAAALAPWAQTGTPPPRLPPAPVLPPGDTLPVDAAATLPTPTVPPARRPGGGSGRVWVVAAGLAAVLAAGAAVAFALHHWGKPDGPGEGRPGPAATPPPRLRLLVPAYFYPGGEGLAEWRRLLKAPDAAAVVIIVNPDSGPGKAADPKYARVIDQARDKGFTLIGYVSTKYAKRPIHEVKGDVDRWVNLYPGVQGIFFDEQASAADRVDYYAALYEYARKARGLSLVVNNPGTSCAEEYLARPAADVVCLVESTKEFSRFRPPGWTADYPASRFAATLYKIADVGRMKQYVRAMGEKRVGYCYLTDNGQPNPWDRLPGYWEEELAAVRQANERKGP